MELLKTIAVCYYYNHTRDLWMHERIIGACDWKVAHNLGQRLSEASFLVSREGEHHTVIEKYLYINLHNSRHVYEVRGYTIDEYIELDGSMSDYQLAIIKSRMSLNKLN